MLYIISSWILDVEPDISCLKVRGQELTILALQLWYMRFVCPLPLSTQLDMYFVWRGAHTLGFLRRGNGFGVDVEAAGATGPKGVGLGVTSSNTAGDDGGGDERLMAG